MTRACVALALLVAGCRSPAASLGSAAPASALAALPLPPASPWQVIGRSVEGRPLEARTFGAGARRVYLVGGIHGDERAGGEVLGALAAQWLGGALPPDVSLRLLRDANLDGTLARRRGNARGVDLNRNFPAASFRPGGARGPAPLSEPEARALHDDLCAFDPELVVVLHAATRGPFVNHDGPAAQAAEGFARAAAAEDPRWRVVADMGYATPGSLGSWIGVDRGIPILTIELDRAPDPERDARALGAGMAAILADPGPRVR